MSHQSTLAHEVQCRGNRWGAVGSMLLPALLALTLSGCASLRPDVARVPSHAITDAERTTLGRVFAGQATEHPGLSGFQVMASGQTAFVARAALADAAERTLDLQYYSADDDLSTDLLLLRLVAAAQRGVRVRIVLDDIYAPSRRFARRAVDLHPGIQVRLFNPFFFGGTASLFRLAEYAFDSERLNRRMHNKLWVTDNAAAIVGSRNLGDEYFDVHQSANFADVDLLAAGPIVNELSRGFDAYWNSAAAVPVQAIVPAIEGLDASAEQQRLRERATRCKDVPPCSWLTESGLLAALRSGSLSLSWAGAQFVYDPPDQGKRPLTSGIEHGWIEDHPGGTRTSRELLIVSPYFIPSAAGRRHLAEMHARGVRVAVLTNSLASTDSPAAHAGYARHRVGLLRAGAELYEVRPIPGVRHRLSHRWGDASPSSLHAKLVVQDRRRAIVGSLNQDPRSRLHNTEAWIALDSAELAADLAALFDAAADAYHAFKVELDDAAGTDRIVWSTEEDAGIVRHDAEPAAGPWLHLWRSILGALIPEHLL
jgi:cardiolipin synthase C